MQRGRRRLEALIGVWARAGDWHMSYLCFYRLKLDSDPADVVAPVKKPL